MGKADQLLTTSSRKCPTLVRTSYETQQGPQGAAKCGAWLRGQEEENTEAEKHQYLYFKRLPECFLCLDMQVPFFPLAFLFPPQHSHLARGETTSHWLKKGHVIQSQPVRKDEFGCVMPGTAAAILGPALG